MIGTVGIIGVGHLATYLVEGLRRAASPPAPHASGGSPAYSPANACPRDIVLSPRNAHRAARLATRYGAVVAASNQAVVDAADLVILSTRPGDVAAAIAGLAFRPDQAVVSTVAGLPLKALRPMVAPALAVRAMPLSCAAINRSPTLLYPDHPPARALFTLLGHVHPLPDESCFTSASVISAFYGWTYALLDEVVAWTAQAGVPPETARSLVLEAVRGAADVALAQPDQSLTAILDTLATPGGITEHGLHILNQRQGLTAWSQALEAINGRLHGLMVETDPCAASSGLETSRP